MRSSLGQLSAAIALLSGVGFLLSACGYGESGISPPSDRIFLPAGLVADPDADFLYVVNSNSDLRYNAGTIVALDFGQVLTVAKNHPSQSYPSCGKTRFSRNENVPSDYCCRDIIDSSIVNCAERQFIQPEATVQIGSFGGSVVLQRFEMNGEAVRRLFIAVRAEPSVTFADVRVRGKKVSIRCTGSRESLTSDQPMHAYCDDTWRIRRPAGATAGAFVLAEEPHSLALDTQNSALYVGHLTVAINGILQGGGVSTLDLCHAERGAAPRFAGQARIVFPDKLAQSVGSLSLSTMAPSQVYATSRFSTEISALNFREVPPDCATASGNRELSLVAYEYFQSSAFLPSGTDVRGVNFSEDGNTAYVLHRDEAESANPSALVAIDRRKGSDGYPVNRPVGILRLCNGPTELKAHDAGAGQRLFITCYEDAQIYVVDPVAFRVDAVIDVGSGPTSLTLSPRHPTWGLVASFAGSHLAVIDLDPRSPTQNRVVFRIGLPYGYGE